MQPQFRSPPRGYFLRVTWSDGSLTFTKRLRDLRTAKRRADAWREVALVTRVQVAYDGRTIDV